MPMNFTLSIDKRNIATITLNRPELHNAFNDELISSLIEVFHELKKNPKLRLVVLTGNGKSFCAGADLNWMKRMKDYSFEENLKDSQNLCELFTTINQFPLPVIGRINGSALGGGAGLVACCDYALAVDNAQFGFTEVRLGLLPAVISPFVISKIGESHARASFLSGVKFNAAKALSMGLIHQITSFDKIDEDLEVVVKEFLQAAPGAQIICKELISKVVSANANADCREFTCEMICKARKSEEGQEGMQALLEKRKANWL
jgi:methylglutaconyl-CoA hydratase